MQGRDSWSLLELLVQRLTNLGMINTVKLGYNDSEYVDTLVDSDLTL